MKGPPLEGPGIPKGALGAKIHGFPCDNVPASFLLTLSLPKIPGGVPLRNLLLSSTLGAVLPDAARQLVS